MCGVDEGPLEGKSRNISRLSTAQSDFCQRVRFEGELENAQVFHQAILDGISDPIMVIDLDYRIILVNQAARKFSYDPPGDEDPKYCFKISHNRSSPCNGTQHPCPIEQVKKTNTTTILEHVHHLPDGDIRHIEVIASPLLSGEGKIQGIIEVMRDITEHKWAEEVLQRYTSRLKALTTRLAEVAETEQQRLAQELHDQIGQNLTALGINLNIVQSKLPHEVDEAVHFHLEDSIALVEETTERTRDVMADLYPPVIDDYGLVAALRWYGERFAKRTNIQIFIDSDEQCPRLATRVEAALFRVTQEAFMNVAKHAEAKNIWVEVETNEKKFFLRIIDDGIGFEPSAITQMSDHQGWGIMVMRERVEAVGGQFSIESNPGGGTEVLVEIPR